MTLHGALHDGLEMLTISIRHTLDITAAVTQLPGGTVGHVLRDG